MKLKNFALTTLLFASCASASAASFDCGKAKTKTEKMICADAELSALDDILSTAYKSAHGRVEDKSGLRQSQRDWLSSYVRAVCADSACLKKAISERIAVLNEIAGSGEPTSTWTGNFVRYWKGKPDTDSASISLLGLKTGRLFVTGSSIWLGANAAGGQVNTGEIEGFSNRQTSDGTFLFDAEGCTARFRLRGDALEVFKESGCGGVNVTFDGQYKRK